MGNTTSPLGPLSKLYDASGALLGLVDAEGNVIDLGGSSGGGFGYLGAVAATANLTALSGVLGSAADVGSGSSAVTYELKTLPASVEANWQPLQGSVPNGTLISIELVPGKLPRRLRVFVPTGNQVTVTVGGVVQPVLTESAQPHVIEISDDPAVAAPTSVTVQRTAGSATTGWYSLEG